MAFTDIPETPLIVEDLSVGGVDLVWVIVALAAWLLLAGGWLLLWVLHMALGRISLFGFHPFNFFYTLCTDALKAVGQQVINRTVALGHWLWALTMTVWRPLFIILVLIGHLTKQLVGVSQNSQSGLAAEKARAQYIEGQMQAQFDATINQLKATYDQAIAGLQQQEGQDFGTAEAQISQLSVRLNNLQIPNLQPQIDQLVAAVNSLDTTLNRDVTDLTTTINGDVSTLNTTISNDVTSINTRVNTVQQSIPTVANGVVRAAIPGIEAALLLQLKAQLDPIKTELATCLEPLCEPVTPNAKQLGDLGKLLKDLEGLFALGAFMALLVAAVEDPKQTARVIVDGTGWISELALGLTDVVGSAAGVNL